MRAALVGILILVLGGYLASGALVASCEAILGRLS